MLKRKLSASTFLNLIYDSNYPNPIINALAAVGDAISRYTETTDHASTQQDKISEDESIDAFQEYQCLEGVIEENTYIVEDLLGIAFVVCQTDISFIISQVIHLDAYCRNNHHYKLNFPTGKHGILGKDPKLINSSVTSAQAIDAFANYFKHKDEWTKPWAEILIYTGKVTKLLQQKKTVEILQIIGAEEKSNYNFRQCTRALGSINYGDISLYIDILDNLRKAIRTDLETELRAQGIVS